MVRLLISSLRCALGSALMLAAGLAAAQSYQIPEPTPGLKLDVVAGKALYDAKCAACHGADLKGSVQGPPMLHKFYESSHHGDRAFQAAARYGVRAHHWNFGNMAPVAGVTADDVAHITAYIRKEQQQVGIY